MTEDKIQETIDKYKRCVCWMVLLSAELVDAELMNNVENLKAYDTLTKAISDAAHGPVDADGETWHVGDMSDARWGAIGDIEYAEGQWRIRGHDMSAEWVPADSLRHWHEPSIKDMLVEFQMKSCKAYSSYSSGESGENMTALVNEYAEKIRELVQGG